MNTAVTVYCGSSSECDRVFLDAAAELGREFAARGIELITGAGRTGLMGAVAAACLEAEGIATGIIPRFMVERGWHNTAMTRLIVTDDMHRRKEQMAQRAKGVIAMPGGIGTFEELLEIITWRQLGLFNGNIVIFNVGNYFAPLLGMLDRAIEAGFMKPDHSGLYYVASSASEALRMAISDDAPSVFSPKF